MSRLSRRRSLFLSLTVLASLLALTAASSASAAFALKVTTVKPDHVTPGNGFAMWLNAQNLGNQPLEGTLTIKTDFPAGVVPTGWTRDENSPIPDPQCQIVGQEAECTVDVTGVLPGVELRFRVDPTVESGATGVLGGGQIEVSGGGSPGSFVEPFELDADPIGPFAISSFDVLRGDAANHPAAQAGADPSELVTRFTLRSEAKTTFDYPADVLDVIAPAEAMRDVVVHVPAGFVGFPTATPVRCTLAQLTSPAEDSNGFGVAIPNCPDQSQVGLTQISNGDISGLFNLVPPPGSPAAFGFYYNGVVITLLAHVRPADNGIDIVTKQVASSIPLPRTEVTLWGVPSAKIHDSLRGLCIFGGFGYNTEQGRKCGLSNRSNAALLRNPTSCPGTDLPWEIEADTYQHPGTFVRRSTTMPATEGCDKVPFEPSISLTPDSRGAHSPSGLDVDLSLPQDTGPGGIATADLKEATVTLPEGVAINPPSADGLQACTDAQLRLGLEGPSQCPDGAKLGSVEVTTPLLDHPLGGSVFLRSQASTDPESGDLFRLAIELRSDRDGLAIKLPGSLTASKSTGRLTASFSDLPQLPFESMRLHFKTGPRAPLSTPSTCGTYSSHAELASWSGKTVELDSPFTVDQGCAAAPFAPGFQAGVANSTAGEFSPFVLRVTRDEGQPNVSRIDATLPEGELAKLAGVPVCVDAQAAAGNCSPGSRIGHVISAIGDGPSPLYLPQAGKAPTALYLAGPYKGAPYSVLASIPAQAGPFDLGQVLVRSALRVDPETTQVTVASDPLPQIFSGIPISYRDVRVVVDRPEFTLNPTDCEPTAVTGSIGSAAGGSAAVSDRFQLADCAHLGFRPSLSLRLKGKARRGGNPALTAVLTMPQKGPGANIAKAVVTLPGSEFIAQDHLNNVCTRVQYAANGGGGAGCPKGSVYGRARAFSPLLDRPLEGPVYLRSNGGDRELPDLVASLDGPIHVDLVGFIDSDKKTGGLRTTFARVPDAPVSKFVLKMGGGKKSLLENSTNICRGKHRASVKMDGQNGKVHDFGLLVRAKCGKGARGR